jgi:hypothetical protein
MRRTEKTEAETPDVETAPAHASLDDVVQVWNLTEKGLRLPNDQYIRGKSSTKVRGWGIWKNDDIVKAWLTSGALTESDPGAPPPP